LEWTMEVAMVHVVVESR